MCVYINTQRSILLMVMVVGSGCLFVKRASPTPQQPAEGVQSGASVPLQSVEQAPKALLVPQRSAQAQAAVDAYLEEYPERAAWFELVADDLTVEPIDETILTSTIQFQLPPPELSGHHPMRMWSTSYFLYPAQEVDASAGTALRGKDEQGFPADAPVHLTGRDWCMAALQGSAHIQRLDGSSLTVNYVGRGSLVIDCGPELGDDRWRTQGTVRFGNARGRYGDGVEGYQLVPYRTLATDPQVIPTGSLVYIPDARGSEFEHNGRPFVHDGYFFAADIGGAIKGDHLDTFTGTAKHAPFVHVGSRPSVTFDAYPITDQDLITSVMERLHR